jgi:hypothetical protein
LIWPFRCVATFAALRCGQLNRPDRHRGGAFEEELVATEAAIAFAPIGVEDPEAGSPPRRAGPVATDHDLQLLADDVATEPNPRAARKLEADAGSLADRGGEIREEPGRLEEHDADPRPPRERAKPPETIGHGRRAIDSGGKIDHEDIDGPP